MADEEWQKVREIFDSALRHKPDERRRFVNEVCGDDKILLAEVESLLCHRTIVPKVLWRRPPLPKLHT
jgi:hypothetical protein